MLRSIRRIGTTILALIAQLQPSGIFGRLIMAGVLAVLAVAAASIAAEPWKPLAWVPCCAALLSLVGVHRAAALRFQHLCDSLDSISLGEVSGRVDTILAGQSGREVDSVREMNQALIDIVQQV